MKLLVLIFAFVMLAPAQTSPAPKKTVPGSPRSEALPDGKTILAKSAEATGGADAKNSIKTQKIASHPGCREGRSRNPGT